MAELQKWTHEGEGASSESPVAGTVATTAATTMGPRLVIVFSGKRKSGKDYICERLEELFEADYPGEAEVGRLSAPLKKAFADENGLDFAELLTDGPYKEKYRGPMIAWGEDKRASDPGFFANLVVAAATAPILIISDARRPTDLQFFADGAAAGKWTTLTVRIEVADDVRQTRGWVYTAGIDDAESECALDGREWGVVLRNDVAPVALDKQLGELVVEMRSH